MEIRFGFVAMSVMIENASPSGTVTVKRAETLSWDERRILCRRTAERNLANTLRILRHADALGIKVYRFSSRLVPLATHPLLEGWDYIGDLSKSLRAIGRFVRDKEMRVSFHPDHFNVLTSDDDSIMNTTQKALSYHARIIEGMGLGREVKLVLHLGGAGRSRAAAITRAAEFLRGFPQGIRDRVTLENDDRVFSATDVLSCADGLDLPVVLDLHHERCNHSPIPFDKLARKCFETWQGSGLRPKVHLSSPAGDGRHLRSHAEWVRSEDFLSLWEVAGKLDRNFDVMVEAKQKDAALVRLKEDLQRTVPGARFEGFTLISK